MKLNRMTGFLALVGWLTLAGCAVAPASPASTQTELAVTAIQPNTVTPAVKRTSTSTLQAISTFDIVPTSTPLPCGTEWCAVRGHFLLSRPIDAENQDEVERSYPFGSTLNGEREPHHGVEFTNPQGTPVIAAADGVVTFAGMDHKIEYGWGTDFYGQLVIIEHALPGVSYPIYTLYAHLSKIDVRTGDTVKTGMKLGEVGSTGSAMGAHLHFEVRVGSNTYQSVRNPELWIKPKENHGILVGQIHNKDGEIRRYPDIKVEYLDTKNTQFIYYPQPYADPTFQGDDEFQEVFLLGDLPAGKYRITFSPNGVAQRLDFDILPGLITKVSFTSKY